MTEGASYDEFIYFEDLGENRPRYNGTALD